MKAIELVLITSLVPSQSVFAGKSFLANQLLKKIDQKSLLKGSLKTVKSEVCENFSGTYEVYCEGDDHDEKEITTIKQNDCFEIQIGKETFYLGGNVIESAIQGNEIGNAIGRMTMSHTLTWNDSQTQINGLTNASFFEGSIGVLSSWNLRKNGESLSMSSNYLSELTSTEGLVGFDMTPLSCTYTPKNPE